MKLTSEIIPPVPAPVVKEYTLKLSQREAELLYMVFGPMNRNDFVEKVNNSWHAKQGKLGMTNHNEVNFFYQLHRILGEQLDCD